jgi:hypothetical protein
MVDLLYARAFSDGIVTKKNIIRPTTSRRWKEEQANVKQND